MYALRPPTSGNRSPGAEAQPEVAHVRWWATLGQLVTRNTQPTTDRPRINDAPGTPVGAGSDRPSASREY